jgi:putative ABC transport system permease protein
MLELKNIYKKYNENYVLKNISLKFPSHGLISILGESGSGKSTLLNLIGLIDSPTRGKIFINDKDSSKLKCKEIDNIHRTFISFIFQQYNLIENMTVDNNININNDSKNFNSIVKMLKIEHLLTKKVCDLSGGEKQRVVIARSLMNNPKIILADEPTGALDSYNRKIVMELLKKISKDCLVIMVTHNEDDAYKYSNRVIKLSDGVIISDSNPYKNDKCLKIPFNKQKIGFKKLINITISNLLGKTKRNIATSIAFSIGLISLFLVLTISHGFNNALDVSEKNSLSKYPIYISSNSLNLDNDLSDLFKDDYYDTKKVYSKSLTHINNITREYLDYLNDIDKYLDYKMYMFNHDGVDYYSYPNNNIYKEFNILKGRTIKNDNEVLLIVDDHNGIDSYLLESIGLNNDTYDIKDLVDYKYKDKTIVGILKAKKESVFYDSNMLITYYDGSIPDTIYLYPKDYNSKKHIIKHLDNYKDIVYTDYSSTIKSVSKNIVNSISIVLIIFSFISLLVSTIMIGIITYINIVEKTKEIGILRSLGFSKSNVKTIFMLESVIIGLISFIISFITLFLLCIPINNYLYKLLDMKNIFVLTGSNILIILLLSIFLCIIGSRFPLRGITKMKIVDTIRYE